MPFVKNPKTELSAEISENDLILLASIYNECLAKVDPFKYQLKFTNGYKDKTWYKELLGLFRLINKLGAKPRDFIQAQISEYKKPIKQSRRIPTIKMMSSEEGIERYNSFLKKRGLVASTVVIVKADRMEFADVSLHNMMKTFQIPTELDVFKDPFLMRQLPREYVKEHPAYKSLCENHFYETEFGVKGLELLS